MPAFDIEAKPKVRGSREEHYSVALADSIEWTRNRRCTTNVYPLGNQYLAW